MSDEITGRIHSVESFGTVDGPGIRFVVFTQGCPLRCKYCHNPDTWKAVGGKRMTAEELLLQYDRNASFYTAGGITVTGGEPLLQMDFITDLFTKAKKKGIHTCIDTSGATFRKGNAELTAKFDALMKVTDLIMLDIKHATDEGYIDLTGVSIKNVLDFAEYTAEKKIPLWVRHVVVPGITDSEEEWKAVGELISDMPNLQALDVLPYHTMGVSKYKSLGIPYPLEGVPALDKSVAAKARNVILLARKAALQERKKANS